VAGDFDDWSKSVKLEWNPDQERFEARVVVPAALGERITYKYFVDGEWKHNEERNTVDDGTGNMNNIFISRVPKARLPTDADTERATEAYKQQYKEVSSNPLRHHLVLTIDNCA